MNVKFSRAFWNNFFESARRAPAGADLAPLVREWYPVTEAFCLGLIDYTSVFAQAVRASSGIERDALEAAFLVPLSIGAEEFGLGKFGVHGIHYRMFARLGKPLGIELDALRRDDLDHLDETRSLVRTIRDSFESLLGGAACVRVVESTAYNIVEAMDHLCRAAKTLDGHPLYSEQDVEYVTLHLELEKEHDCLTEGFADACCRTEADREEVAERTADLCQAFGSYWDGLAARVFTH